MKAIRNLATVVILVLGLTITATAGDNNKPETPTAPSTNTEKTLTVKNSCEKPIIIFAGAKEGIRDPKITVYGGLSQNKVYVYPGDVVCLMTNDKKPTACTVVKPETNLVEVNVAGNAIASK